MSNPNPLPGELLLVGPNQNEPLVYIQPSTLIDPVVGVGAVNDIPVFTASAPPVLKDSGALLTNAVGNITIQPAISGKNILLSSVAGNAFINGGGNNISVEASGIVINDAINTNSISTSSTGLVVNILGSAGGSGNVLTSNGTNASWSAPVGGGVLYALFLQNNQQSVPGGGTTTTVAWNVPGTNNIPTLSLVSSTNFTNNDIVSHTYLVTATCTVDLPSTATTAGAFNWGIFFQINGSGFIEAADFPNQLYNGGSTQNMQATWVFEIPSTQFFSVIFDNEGATDTTLDLPTNVSIIQIL